MKSKQKRRVEAENARSWLHSGLADLVLCNNRYFNLLSAVIMRTPSVQSFPGNTSHCWMNHCFHTLTTVVPLIMSIWTTAFYTYSVIELFSNCTCKQDNYLLIFLHISKKHETRMEYHFIFTNFSVMAVFSQPVCKWLWPNLCSTKLYPLENDLMSTGVFEERKRVQFCPSYMCYLE